METDFNPNWCSAPGDTIYDILKYRYIDLEDFSKSINLSLIEVYQLIDGDYKIDLELAITLGNYFNTSPYFWINRERIYRERLSKGVIKIKVI